MGTGHPCSRARACSTSRFRCQRSISCSERFSRINCRCFEVNPIAPPYIPAKPVSNRPFRPRKIALAEKPFLHCHFTPYFLTQNSQFSHTCVPPRYTSRCPQTLAGFSGALKGHLSLAVYGTLRHAMHWHVRGHIHGCFLPMQQAHFVHIRIGRVPIRKHAESLQIPVCRVCVCPRSGMQRDMLECTC